MPAGVSIPKVAKVCSGMLNVQCATCIAMFNVQCANLLLQLCCTFCAIVKLCICAVVLLLCLMVHRFPRTSRKKPVESL